MDASVRKLNYSSIDKFNKIISIIDIYMYILLLFPIMTVVQDYGIINKLMFGLLLAIQIAVLLKYGVTKNELLIFFVLCCNYMYTLLQTRFPINNINLLIYYPSFIVYIQFYVKNKKILLNWLVIKQGFVKLMIWIWTFIVGISIFLPSSYNVKEGGQRYFGSFCGTIFRLGPSAVFIMGLCLVAMALYNKRKYIFFMAIPLYSTFMGSSRTYLLIGASLFIIGWYWYCPSKRDFYRTIIPIGIISLIFVINSAIGEKIKYTLDDSNYGDFWFRITSSRSVLWENNLRGMANENFLNKLFGAGIEFTTNLTGLWAHNDFIEIFCSFGFLGIAMYYRQIKYVIKNVLRKNAKVPNLIMILAIASWFINAMFNMFYVYFCALLSYPIILSAINYKYIDKENK